MKQMLLLLLLPLGPLFACACVYAAASYQTKAVACSKHSFTKLTQQALQVTQVVKLRFTSNCTYCTQALFAQSQKLRRTFAWLQNCETALLLHVVNCKRPRRADLKQRQMQKHETAQQVNTQVNIYTVVSRYAR